MDDKGVGYSSVSKKLSYGVQTLLLRFGILSIIREKTSRINRKFKYENEHIDYTLEIRRFSDVVNFSNNVGIFSKQEKLNGS